MILLSLVLAFWVNYGVSRWTSPTIAYDNGQWRTAMSIQLIPGALMVLQIPFVKESPRYLINKGKSKSFFTHCALIMRYWIDMSL